MQGSCTCNRRRPEDWWEGLSSAPVALPVAPLQAISGPCALFLSETLSFVLQFTKNCLVRKCFNYFILFILKSLEKEASIREFIPQLAGPGQARRMSWVSCVGAGLSALASRAGSDWRPEGIQAPDLALCRLRWLCWVLLGVDCSFDSCVHLVVYPVSEVEFIHIFSF